MPPHIVQAIVGHADVHVTTTIYAHASLEDQRRALDKLAVLPRRMGALLDLLLD